MKKWHYLIISSILFGIAFVYSVYQTWFIGCECNVTTYGPPIFLILFVAFFTVLQIIVGKSIKSGNKNTPAIYFLSLFILLVIYVTIVAALFNSTWGGNGGPF
jgi:hypothetical protein